MFPVLPLSFLAGLMVANGLPHFVRGITKQSFPCLMGDGPLPNLVAGWSSMGIGVLCWWAAGVGDHPMAAAVAAGVGALAIGVFHATYGADGLAQAVRSRPRSQA